MQLKRSPTTPILTHCVFRWVSRLLFWENPFPQNLHLHGLGCAEDQNQRSHSGIPAG